MIVDDSDFSRKSISEVLDNEDFKVVGEASSSQEAIKIAATTNPHLIIIDVVMPEISGLELINLLKELDKQCIILMISSLTTESVIIEAITSGANDFLKKPFEKKDLICAVEKLAEFAKTEKIL